MQELCSCRCVHSTSEAELELCPTTPTVFPGQTAPTRANFAMTHSLLKAQIAHQTLKCHTCAACKATNIISTSTLHTDMGPMFVNGPTCRKHGRISDKMQSYGGFLKWSYPQSSILFSEIHGFSTANKPFWGSLMTDGNHHSAYLSISQHRDLPPPLSPLPKSAKTPVACKASRSSPQWISSRRSMDNIQG